MKRHRYRWQQAKPDEWVLMSGGVGGGFVLAIVQSYGDQGWRWRLSRIDAIWQTDETRFIAQRKARDGAEEYWRESR